MRAWSWVVCIGVAGLALGACTTDACSDYVDYMCACHDGEDEESCADLEKQFEDADAALQDECSISLDEQKEQDDADGLVCKA